MEAEAEKIYNDTLNGIMYPILGKKLTWGRDLNKLGLKLFNGQFAGVFPSDRMPPLGLNPGGGMVNSTNVNKRSKLYAVMNLDNSQQPGSHWIGLAYHPPTQKIWVYDSYGRPTQEIVPSLVKEFGNKLRQVDDDAEQKILEDDCGARVMAWLYIFDRKGVNVAKLI